MQLAGQLITTCPGPTFPYHWSFQLEHGFIFIINQLVYLFSDCAGVFVHERPNLKSFQGLGPVRKGH